MKNYLLLLSAFLLLFTSCSKSEDLVSENTYATYNNITYFRFPVMSWGASVNTVKTKMADYNLASSSATSLIYDGKYREFATVYLFESNKLDRSGIYISTSNISSEALIYIINKRFKYIGVWDNVMYYEKGKTVCGLDVQTINSQVYNLLAFFEDDDTRSADANTLQSFSAKFESIKQQMAM